MLYAVQCRCSIYAILCCIDAVRSRFDGLDATHLADLMLQHALLMQSQHIVCCVDALPGRTNAIPCRVDAMSWRIKYSIDRDRIASSIASTMIKKH